ncbi:hypothetical protein [Microbacterium lacticum]
MKILSSLSSPVWQVSGYVPPSGGSAPPGMENVNTIITWALWGVGAVLFVYFITGLVQAAQARNSGGRADASAPVWPLVLAIVLGASGTIWNAIA